MIGIRARDVYGPTRKAHFPKQRRKPIRDSPGLAIGGGVEDWHVTRNQRERHDAHGSPSTRLVWLAEREPRLGKASNDEDDADSVEEDTVPPALRGANLHEASANDNAQDRFRTRFDDAEK